MNIFLMFIDVLSASTAKFAQNESNQSISSALTQWINLSCRLAKASKRTPLLIKTSKVYPTRLIVMHKVFPVAWKRILHPRSRILK